MSYETIPVEMKDSGTVHVLTGTVTAVGDGVIDLNIDGHGSFTDVPVFYHCPNEETADGVPFSIDDRVIIINTGDAVSLSVADMKVVGFEDGLLRGCHWEPWDGEVASTNQPFETNKRLWQTNADLSDPASWVLSDGKVTHNSSKTVTCDYRLAFGAGWPGEEESVKIPTQQMFVNISALISGGAGNYNFISILLRDEHSNSKNLVVVATFDVSVFGWTLIGESTGKDPISIAPLQDSITGIEFIVYGSDFVDRTFFYSSDFIDFK